MESEQQEASPATSQRDLFPIVAIGGSAGGLEAFSALFAALPATTGMAFVVLSHLQAEHPSALPAILAGTTRMPVAEALDGQAIERNHVYVLPPGRLLAITGDRLQLTPRAAQEVNRPIDLFFRTLAEDRGHQAIGIVLSGTASDGTLGLRAIKAAGGVTFAQDGSAREGGMPHSAIADGSVDFVLPPDAVAAELVRISQLPLDLITAEPGPRADDPSVLSELLQLVHRVTGVDFSQYKVSSLRRRTLRRMIVRRVDSLAAYLDIVRDHPEEAQALHDDLLIGVTSFFRDPDAFEALAQSALPRLLRAERGHEPLRVWVLGCSTGEEAYSLAIALVECAEALGVSVPLQIFASDVNPSGLKIARSGVYPHDIAQDVSPARLARFFTDSDGQYRVVKSIRDVCVFSRHNALVDPPFSRIDLVSCRNFLIYLQPPLQQEIIRSLHYALAPDGVLWLGSADTVGSHQNLFDVIDGAHKIFARRAGSRSRPTVRRAGWPRRPASGDSPATTPALDLAREGDRVLLARFAPAGIVVSRSLEVVQFRGDVGPYIAPASGKASLHLLQVLDRRLQAPVRAAVTRAQREGTTVREDGIVPGGDTERRLAIEVVPIGRGADGFLILFDESRADGGRPASVAASEPTPPTDVTRLARELEDTRLHLQTVLEQNEFDRDAWEAEHEDAQSAAEELQSINEELETSKEEIQSANEELTTLNDELQHRNDEIQQSNSDLLNLLSSTELAVVFIGAGSAIRRFTPAAASSLGVRPADVGRPLREVRFPFALDIESLVAATMVAGSTFMQDVQDHDHRWWSLRVRPYRTADGLVTGAVLVVVDIDRLVRARVYAERIIATVRTPLAVLNEQCRIVTANETFYRMFQTTAAKAADRSLTDLPGTTWAAGRLQELLHDVASKDTTVEDFEAIAQDAEGVSRVLMLDARRLPRVEAEPPLMLLSLEDVTARRQAEQLQRQRVDELSAADRSRNEFLAILAHELRNPLAPIRAAAELLATGGLSSASLAHARSILDRQVRHMVRLIDDLLDVSRITYGKIELRMMTVDLTSVLRRCTESVNEELRKRDQHLLATLPDAPTFVIGDPVRLEQIFGNLLSNASKYTPRGGHIAIALEAPPQEGRREVSVRLTDDGIGITADMLPHVFEPFKQAQASPHHATGLGLGLALVHRLVLLHGGRVAVESRGPGRGSEFVVRLPVVEVSQPGLEPEEDASQTTPLHGIRVLVVDDNVDYAESLSVLLRAWGHEVQVAHNGRQALTVATAFHPSVVFCDLGMPELDGFGFARGLRATNGGANALLVAVSGFGRDTDRQAAAQAGFDEYLTKPADPRALRRLLQRA